MRLKCLAVDDEPYALDVLETYIQKIDDLELVTKCTNAIDAFNLIQKEKIDVLFLDIQMPKLTGIDFLKNITNPPQVIFTTAYRDYALDGYDLNITDYLLKPFSFERFLKAINKVYLNSQTQDSNINQIKDEAIEQNIIYFKADKKMLKVWLDDIFYIESMKDYVFVKTLKREIISYQKISFLDEKLPGHKFLRIHRSFIIAVDKIEAFCATHVDVAGKEIPIGRNYKNQVLEKLNQENLLNAD
ncbi:MAG: LytTR family DNA-binding domain-containing protein [Bacteroidetes bacterium]|nr:LytTR family DNA-binding domain-containing protein [Bacteroidota bacterium]